MVPYKAEQRHQSFRCMSEPSFHQWGVSRSPFPIGWYLAKAKKVGRNSLVIVWPSHEHTIIDFNNTLPKLEMWLLIKHCIYHIVLWTDIVWIFISYPHMQNGNSYTGKIGSSVWIGEKVFFNVSHHVSATIWSNTKSGRRKYATYKTSTANTV